MKHILSILICGCALSASAVNIDSIALEIAGRQPALVAERASIEADYQRALDENMLAGPEVEAEYKFAPSAVPNRWGVSVGQTFDWPGLYAARAKENRLRGNAMQQLHRTNLLDKALEVKTAIIRLCKANASRSDVAKATEAIEALGYIYRKALARGETTILEVRKIEMQAYAMKMKLAEVQAEAEAARIAFETLAGGNYDSAMAFESIPMPELKPLSFYSEAMLDANPLLRYSVAQAEAAQAATSVARRSALPSFSVSYIHDYEEGVHFNGFGISISLPKWNSSHSVKAAQAQAVAADNILADARQAASAELYATYARAAAMQQTMAGAVDIFNGDYDSLLRKALDAGRISLFTYLTEYTDYIDNLLAYRETAAEYACTEATLARYSTDL